MNNKRMRIPEYRTWASMIQRCTNPNSRVFYLYGGRGISVCEDWRSYEYFLRDMGARPQGASLDRMDNNGNYEPGNCRWATDEQQRDNRRCTVQVTVNGESMPLAAACKMLGLPRHPIYKRIRSRGWTPEMALSIPLEGRHRKCR